MRPTIDRQRCSGLSRNRNPQRDSAAGTASRCSRSCRRNANSRRRLPSCDSGLGQRAREVVCRNFTIQHVNEQTIQIYRELLNA